MRRGRGCIHQFLAKGDRVCGGNGSVRDVRDVESNVERSVSNNDTLVGLNHTTADDRDPSLCIE